MSTPSYTDPTQLGLRNQLLALEDGMYRTPEESRDQVRALLHDLESTEDYWARAFALILLSGSAFYLGEPRETTQLATEGLVWARRAGAPELECRLLNGLGLAYHRLGEYDRAFEYFLLALRLAQQLGNAADRFRVLNNLASLYADTGSLQLALETLQEALGIAQDLSPPFLGAAMTHMIDIRTQLGEYDIVLQLATEHTSLIHTYCPPRWWGTIQRSVTRSLLALGRAEDALAAAQAGLQEAYRQQDHENICTLTLAVASAHLQLKHWDEAEPLLNQGLLLSREKGSRPLECEALDLLGSLYDGQRRFEQALRFTRQHFELERQLRNREVESRSQLLTAQIRLELLEREAEIERLRNVELAQANSALQETQEVLLYKATHDPLTGTANRAHFQHRTQQALESLQLGEHLALIFIDLDKFKHVNDTLGHHAGDQLLQEVTRRLCQVVRTTDLVGRVGGDEFTVLLPRIAAVPDAQMVATKVLQALSEPFRIVGQTVQLTASIGCAVAPVNGRTAEILQQHADVAMYRVKHLGGNQVLAFEAEMGEPGERRRLEHDLQQAQGRNELRLYYQGQFHLRGDTTQNIDLCGYEALLRWIHPERGLISPDVFIPMAEESGAILAIGIWVLHEACAQAVQWGFAQNNLTMSVNVSPRQFERLTFVEEVQAALLCTGLPAKALVLEITESLVIRNPSLAQQHIQELKTLGVQVAIDDFGTGYSSLSVLQALPFNLLKVDRSFTRSLMSVASPRVMALLKAIVQLAHSLDMMVTAEGIENDVQRQCLMALGCDHIQGFLLARPLPPIQAQELLPETP